MTDNPNSPRQQRETILTLMLTFLFGGGILFFLILVSGGFFFYVLTAVAIIAAVGFLHYILWGQALVQETAGEREEAEAQARRDSAMEPHGNDHIRPRRF
jgi:hypothetical protein